MAAQLRILLCDGKNSLLPKLVKNLYFHPLLNYISKEEDEKYKKEFGHSSLEGMVFQLPALTNFDGKGGSRIIQLFDKTRNRIGNKEWLSQPLFSKEVTIQKLIKSVSDKESVHSDDDYDDTLRMTKSVKLASIEIHPPYIIAIGEYLLEGINALLEGT